MNAVFLLFLTYSEGRQCFLTVFPYSMCMHCIHAKTCYHMDSRQVIILKYKKMHLMPVKDSSDWLNSFWKESAHNSHWWLQNGLLSIKLANHNAYSNDTSSFAFVQNAAVKGAMKFPAFCIHNWSESTALCQR